MDYDAWRQYFEGIVQVPEEQLELDKAALVIASDAYPDLDVSHYLAQLDGMAATVKPNLPSKNSPPESIAALNRHLFSELGFRGNRENYYDPRNSYLNDIIERRVGLPITLSLVYLSVGRRLDLPLYGVGLPGHFLVKWQDDESIVLIDPFNEGELLDARGAEERVRDTYDPNAEFQAQWLESVGSKYILIRLLNNLKLVFLQAEEFRKAWRVVDKMLVLEPHSAENIRDMGLLSLRLGAYRKAATHLEEYLLEHPEASDANQIRNYLHSAWREVERLN